MARRDPMTRAEKGLLAAVADLVHRSGGRQFELGYLHEGVPIDKAGWYAQARYRGRVVTSGEQPHPAQACAVLAEKLMEGGTCRRCGNPITLYEARPGCFWRVVDDRFVPGCGKPINRAIQHPYEGKKH